MKIKFRGWVFEAFFIIYNDKLDHSYDYHICIYKEDKRLE